MQSKLLNPRDLEFVLYELLDVESLTQRPRFADHSRETFDAALDTAAKIADEQFAPHNRKADQNEPHFEGERVHMIPEVKRGAGGVPRGRASWPPRRITNSAACSCPGRWRRPASPGSTRRNVSTAAYPFLTIANANLIRGFRHGATEAALPAAAAVRALLRHDVPVRTAGRLVAVRHPHRARSRSRTAAIACSATRCGSRAASTSCRRTSSTWCWRGSRARRPA